MKIFISIYFIEEDQQQNQQKPDILPKIETLNDHQTWKIVIEINKYKCLKHRID